MSEPMSPEEFAEKMRELFCGDEDTWDKERSHAVADDLMCGLLATLGYGDGVTVFVKADKWYA